MARAVKRIKAGPTTETVQLDVGRLQYVNRELEKEGSDIEAKALSYNGGPGYCLSEEIPLTLGSTLAKLGTKLSKEDLHSFLHAAADIAFSSLLS